MSVKYETKKLALEINIETFVHDQISLVSNKVYLQRKLWHSLPFTRFKLISSSNFDKKKKKKKNRSKYFIAKV